MTLAKVVRKGSYQGVPQWGVDTSSEITPSHATAQKWADLENARILDRERIHTENLARVKKTFAQLSIGDTFDFIDMSRPMFNSFYRRCVKTSTRKYETIDAPVMQCRVGSVSARVYHVADGRDLAMAKQSLMHAADHLMSQYNPIETIGHSHYCYSGDLKAVDLLRKFGE